MKKRKKENRVKKIKNKQFTDFEKSDITGVFFSEVCLWVIT